MDFHQVWLDGKNDAHKSAPYLDINPFGTVPAIAGMTTGIAFTAFYIIGSVYAGMPDWFFGIGPQGIGVVGMVINFAVTLGLTPLTRAPSEQVRDMIDRIHEPEGAGPAVVIEATPEH